MTAPEPMMTDAEKLASAEEFVNKDGFGLKLADLAREFYQKSGRGCWVVEFRPGNPGSPCQWASGIALAEQAAGPTRDELIRRVAAYDPVREYVLFVGHFDGSMVSYTLQSGPAGSG